MFKFLSKLNKLALSIFIVLILFGFGNNVSAAADSMLEFNGKVAGADGGSLPSANYDFKFKIYDAPENGNLLWSEDLTAATCFAGTVSSIAADEITFTGGLRVGTLRVGQRLTNQVTGESFEIVNFDAASSTVKVNGTPAWIAGAAISNQPFIEGGVVALSLGSVTSLAGVNFGDTLYLDVEFNGEMMRPRKILAAAATAFNADSLGGVTASAFANIFNNQTISGAWIFDNILNIATSSMQSALTVTQDGGGNIVDFKYGTTTAMAILADGRMQIGDGGAKYIFPGFRGVSGQTLIASSTGDLYWGTPTGSGSVTAGLAGQLAFYGVNTDNVEGTSDIFRDLMSGYIGIGTTTPAERLTVDGNLLVTGNINLDGDLLTDINSDVGSATHRFGAGYFTTLDVLGGITIASSSISGSVADYFTINSDAAGDENSGVAFYRGPALPSATIAWDAAADILKSDFPLGVLGGQTLRLYDNDSSNYIGLRATGTVPADIIFTLPVNAGALNNALITNGNGALTWADLGVTYLQRSQNLADLTSTSTARTNLGLTDAYDNRNFFIDSAGSLGSMWHSDGVGRGAWLATSSLGIALADTTGVLAVNRGGTGTTTFAQYSLVYASAANTIGQITTAGSQGKILQVDGTGRPFWAATTTLGINFTGVGGFVDQSQGGTGTSSSNWLGFAYVNNGVWSASTTDFITRGGISENITGVDYAVGTGVFSLSAGYNIPLTASTTNWNTSYNWTLNGHGNWDLAYTAVNASSTQWSSAYGWGDHATQNYFDKDIDVLSVARGGTGTTTFSQYSLVYASAADTIGEIVTAGQSGKILQVDATGRPIWASTSTLGIDINAAGTLLPASGGTGQDSSAWTGFAYVDSGVWSASNTISRARLDSLVMVAGEDVSLLGNDANYISRTGISESITGMDYATTTGIFTLTTGYVISLTASTTQWNTSYNWTLNGHGNWDLAYGWGDHASAGYAVRTNNLSDLSSTSTARTNLGLADAYTYRDFLIDSAGANGSIWRSDGNGRGAWLATSSLGISLTDTTGTLSAARGGTGRTSITDQALIVGGAGNTFSELLKGGEGTVLAVQGGILKWATTSAPAEHGILSVSHSNVKATSTLERGDFLVVDSDSEWTRLKLGTNGYIMMSNGSDPIWQSTTNITSLGTIMQGVWQGTAIGVAYGGTGATSTEAARLNLGLDDVYKFGVNATGTNGDIWQSDGNGRGQWVGTSSLGIGAGGVNFASYIGTTTATTDGTMNSNGKIGYEAANDLCDAAHTGSHICQTYEIIYTIQNGDITGWGNNTIDAWIAEGPPGYTANSNDCQGWQSASGGSLGAYWKFNATGGGYGTLINCASSLPVACCR